MSELASAARVSVPTLFVYVQSLLSVVSFNMVEGPTVSVTLAAVDLSDVTVMSSLGAAPSAAVIFSSTTTANGTGIALGRHHMTYLPDGSCRSRSSHCVSMTST